VHGLWTLRQHLQESSELILVKWIDLKFPSKKKSRLRFQRQVQTITFWVRPGYLCCY
jgi:hypothetical protein